MSSRRESGEGAGALDALTADLRPALERLNVPVYVLDRDRRIRWLNDAAEELVGPMTGHVFTDVVAPEHADRVREEFARKLLGAKVTDFGVNVLGPDGRRVRVEVSSTPLEDEGQVVGVFGIVRAVPDDVHPPLPPDARLTPRQHDVLVLLDSGCSTAEIAAELGVSPETVRNHLREVFRRLGVRSRIAALATARRHGLV
jgi:PAS domain S-box-containing protein